MFCNFKLADFLGWVCATNLSYHSPARLLSQVTNTLYSAGSDIFHFMIVLMTIFFSYAIAGVFLLGRISSDFMNMEFATMTCFQIIMGKCAGDLQAFGP